MDKYILSGDYNFKFGFLLVICCVLFSYCSRPTIQVENSPVLKVLTVTEWDSIQDIVYNNPEVYLDSLAEFKSTLNNYSVPKMLEEEYAWLLIEMAYNFFIHKAKLQIAADLYEEALNYIHEKELSNNVDVYTYIYKPLGNCYTMMKNYEKSQRLIEHAIQTTDNPKNRSALLNNLGISYLYSEKYDLAISTIKSEIKKHQFTAYDYALACNILAESYFRKSQLDSSSYYNKQALDIFKNKSMTGDTLIWKTASYEMHANLALTRKDSITAYSSTLKIIDILEQNFPDSRIREKAKIYNLMASLTTEQKSMEYADKALALLSNNNEERYAPDFIFTTALVNKAEAYKNIDSSINYYIHAIENDFRTQQLITSSEADLSNKTNNKLVNKALKLLHSKYQQASLEERSAIALSALWITELGKSRQLINDIHRSRNWLSQNNSQISEALKQLQVLYQEKAYANDKEKQELTKEIDKLLLTIDLNEEYFDKIFEAPNKSNFINSLKEKEAYYFSAFRHPDSTYTITTLYKNEVGLSKTEDKNFPATLNQFKQEYFSDNPKAYNNNPKQYNLQSEYIKNTVLTNLPDHIKTIYVSADAELNGLPFDALWHNGAFMIKSYDIANLNSFLMFNILTQKNTKAKISTIYKANYTAPLPNLPYVIKEAEMLKSTFNSNIYSPEQQSLKDLNKILSRGDIIHIAAHATLENNDAPILHLNENIPTDALSFFEVQSPLVFLAACNTAQGKKLSSEGIAGLNRSFLSKGVPSVLSTYWTANDEITMKLTQGFYEHLQHSNNPITSLADSKRDFLKSASSNLNNPWYWSNINYYGIDSSIQLNSSNKTSLILTTMLISLVILFFYIKN